MVRKQNTKKIQWPCGRCKKNCETSCVFCAICEKWYHCDCESVPLGKLKTISDNPEDYICETCRCEDGKFDFLMGLERLKQVGFFFLSCILYIESTTLRINSQSMFIKNKN